jgi:tripartite-type tricarboxylate transporter receptor subunit TctC
MSLRALATVAAIAAIASVPAVAQDFPTRPLTLVVPYAPGGPADIVTRIVTPKMTEVLGQQIIVENVPGAGGMTGAARVARAAPDGYTFMQGPAGVMTQNQSLYTHPLVNGETDFAAIGLIATAPPILIVRNDMPVKNLQEFIAWAKANQQTLKFGSAGAGSGPHVTCVLLNSAIGITGATHIPYRGSAAAEQDLVASRFDYLCDFVSTALPQINGKTVKPIAVLTRERSPVVPDLPTADEQGLKGFDTPGWYAFVAPAKTPEPAIRRLNQALLAALDTPSVRERLGQLGNAVPPADQRSPEFLTQFIRSEIAKWAVPIKASGTVLN